MITLTSISSYVIYSHYMNSILVALSLDLAMSQGQNRSGICICTDETCTITIAWAPINGPHDFIETSITSIDSSNKAIKSILRNLSKVIKTIILLV